MDDWKLSAVTVVRLEKELNMLVSLSVPLFVQSKLLSYGISNLVINWIREFITGRRYRVSGGFRGGGGGWAMPPPPRPPSKILLAVWSRYKSSICRIYLFQS